MTRKVGYIKLSQSRSKTTGRFEALSNDELWDRYETLYEKSEDKLRRRHDEMYVKKMSKPEFMHELISARNDGQKVGAQYVRDLVADQEYKISRKSAQASAKAYRQYAEEHPEFVEEIEEIDEKFKGRGGKIQSWNFRRGLDVEDDPRAQIWFNMLSDEYQALRNEGKTGKEAHKKISSRFYGSPE